MTFSFCFFLFYLYLGFNVSLIRNKLSVIFCLSTREVVQRRIWKGCLFVSTKDYLVCFLNFWLFVVFFFNKSLPCGFFFFLFVCFFFFFFNKILPGVFSCF